MKNGRDDIFEVFEAANFECKLRLSTYSRREVSLKDKIVGKTRRCANSAANTTVANVDVFPTKTSYLRAEMTNYVRI